MKIRIITSVAAAASLSLALAACEKPAKIDTVNDPVALKCGTSDSPPCPTAGPARTDGAPEQQK